MPTQNSNTRWFTQCFAPYRTLMNRNKKKEKESMREDLGKFLEGLK